MALFFTGISFASADQSWTRDYELSGGFLEIDESFDAISFELSDDFSVEYLDNRQWKLLQKDNEQDPFSTLSDLILWKKGEPLRLRFSGNFSDHITAHLQKIEMADTVLPEYASLSVGGVPIVSRAEWGADESIRYDGEHEGNDVEIREAGSSAAKARANACTDAQNIFPDEFELDRIIKTENGNNLIWPYQYSKKIRKIVIHHTAETGAKKGLTGEEIIRSIYHYHAITRGWGDIGYHYLIGADGRIFQGRAGGDSVVAGHVYCNNIGTIGISLMGNFEENEPTAAQIRALQTFLPVLAKKYQLDLTDTEYFHGKKTPNLIGHRDLAATACPGKNLYAKLPNIRKYLSGTAEIIYTKTLKVDGEPVGSPPILKLEPGRSADITLAFKNTGSAVWNGATWLFANPGEGVMVRSAAPNGKKYFAARMKEVSVASGEIAHFSVHLDAGYAGGLYTVDFVPIVDDRRIPNAETLQVVEVEAPNFDGKLVSFKTEPKIASTGKSLSVAVNIKNTGKTRWTKGKIVLRLKDLIGKTETTLDLKKTTSSGATATFLGRIPAVLMSGERNYLGEVFFENRKIGVRFSQTIDFISAQNKAKNIDLTKRLRLINASDFVDTVRFQNIGTETWSRNDLRLEIRKGRKSWKLFPNETQITSGSPASFDLNLPLSNRLSPFFFMLKDGTRILDKKLVLMKSIGKTSSVTKTLAKTTVSKPSPSAQNTTTRDKIIRIQLSFPFEKFAEIGGSFTVVSPEGEQILKGRKVKIETLGDQVRVKNRLFDFVKIIPQNSNGLEILHWDRYPAWDTAHKWNDNLFSGNLEVRMYDDKLTVINELPLETYLQGLAETAEDEPFEKKKAISVVARSYAEFYIDSANRKFPGAPFDGSDDPNEFQKYLGARFAQRAPEWKKALSETVGEVLTYNDNLIKTPFHSCSGGKTESAFDAWGWTNAPYLVSVNDPGGVGKKRAGHGVGLSGCGAKYFADQGETYREILEYYYLGTELKKK